MGYTSTSTSFDGKHTLEYTDTGKTHIYKLNGIRVPGATTVGAAYPKGEGLIRWMIKQGIEEHDNKTKLSKAGAIGTVVHKYAECHMKGETFDWQLVTGAEDADIITECIRQYDAWSAGHSEDQLYAAEILVGSPSLMVATQIDLLVKRGSDLITRDYKTSKKIYVSALHQTILGRRMAKEWLGVESNKLEIIKFSKEPSTIPFEHCVVDNDGMTLNGQYFAFPGLLDELEKQEIRNIETYRHINSVEKILNKYYGFK